MTAGTPDHPIRLEPAHVRWRARYNNHVIADSAHAIVVREADLPAVVYFPREDVAMEYMARTDAHTTCPYKGEASYYTLRISGLEENVAWSYEAPKAGVESLSGYIAFYSNRVDIYSVDEELVNPHHHQDPSARHADVDQVIQHTDSGSGASQGESWKPDSLSQGPEGGLR